MLNRILFFSIHNKVIVGLGLLGLILWGSFSALKLPIDAVPDITNNQVQIITNSPSLSPTEVERLITAPLELQFSNMPDLQELRSISRFGLSVITAVFSDETEVYKARQMVSERLATAGELIPPSLGQPGMGPVSTGLGEIFQYVVRPKPGFESRYSLSDLRTLQDWTIRRALLGTPGVADVSSFGGHVAQFDVVFKPENLRRFNVSVQTLFDALQQNNANAGGAYIARGPQAWYIRTEGLVYNLEQIRDIPIQTNTQSVPVRVRDLAEVRMGQAIRYGALTLADKGEGVGGIVLMLKGENSGKVTQAVEEKMDEIRKMLPPGLEIEVYLNRTHLVDRAISTVRNNLIEGALIVIFVLVLLLGNVRAGLIVASVIPLSLLFAIGMMQAFGVSGNLMSLGAIDFGLIVDGAVILVEATLHHLNRLPKDTLVARTMDEEVFTATSRIRNSAAFGEIIILIVYLPLLALVGIEGKMFRPMAQTVAFAIAGAFILSLTWVPMASALFLRPDTRHKPTWSDRFIDALYRGYVPILNALIRRGKLVVFVSLMGMAGAFFLFFQLGGEFIPSLDEGDFAVETRLLPGTSLEKTIEVSQQAAKLLKAEFPEVRGVIGKIGTSEIPTDPMPFEACDLMVLLHDKSTWVSAETKSELAEKMQAKLAVIPGVTFGFQQPIQMRFNELMTGARQDVAIKVFGHDMELLASTATRLGRLVQSINGVSDLYVERIDGLPEIVARINQAKLARYGLHVDEVNRTLSTAFAGAVAGQIYEGEKRFDMVLKMEKSDGMDLEHVQNLLVATPDGRHIPLKELAEVAFEFGPNQVQRDNSKRRITVAFNVRERDVESVVKEIRSAINAKLHLPTGFHIDIGGQFKNMEEAKRRLSIALPIALTLIFFLLYITFHSFSQTLLVFSAIPLSAIGGVLALWFREMPFSISAGVGFIALFGVAVLNGIVLMAEFNRLHTEGFLNVEDRILQGTRSRLRPVLMTALVASLGFLPMAFSHGAGAEVQKPLATVVIGGLVSATLLTLFVLPVLYALSEKKFRKTASRAVLGLLLLLVVVGSANAQVAGNNEKDMETLMASMRQSHPWLKACSLEVASSKAMKSGARDIGKTSFQAQLGQYNSYYGDQNLMVSHTFPFPGSIRKMQGFQGQMVLISNLMYRWAEIQLETELRRELEKLFAVKEKQFLYRKMDSLFVRADSLTSIRQRKGAASELEVAMARTSAMEMRMRLQQMESELESIKNQIQFLTGSSIQNIPEKGIRFPIPVGLTSQYALDTATRLQLARQEEALRQWSLKLERNRLNPDLTVGYFNQSLRGIPLSGGGLAGPYNRFQGIQLGISAPVWQRPVRDKIKAAELQVQAQNSRVEMEILNIRKEWAQTLSRFEVQKNLVRMHEQGLLPMAGQIRSGALLQLQTGSIGLLDFLQVTQKTLFQEEQAVEARHQLYLLALQLSQIQR